MYRADRQFLRMAKDQAAKAAFRHRHEGQLGLWACGDLGELHIRNRRSISYFCILHLPANELIATIHDRMPVILPPDAYHRWLSPVEPDPRICLCHFLQSKLRMWPVSTRVNSPRNDDADLLIPIE